MCGYEIYNSVFTIFFTEDYLDSYIISFSKKLISMVQNEFPEFCWGTSMHLRRSWRQTEAQDTKQLKKTLSEIESSRDRKSRVISNEYLALFNRLSNENSLSFITLDEI